jgi:hypothetical protein
MYHLILNESCFLIENRAQNGKQSQLITNLRLKLTAVTVYIISYNIQEINRICGKVPIRFLFIHLVENTI